MKADIPEWVKISPTEVFPKLPGLLVALIKPEVVTRFDALAPLLLNQKHEYFSLKREDSKLNDLPVAIRKHFDAKSQPSLNVFYNKFIQILSEENSDKRRKDLLVLMMTTFLGANGTHTDWGIDTLENSLNPCQLYRSESEICDCEADTIKKHVVKKMTPFIKARMTGRWLKAWMRKLQGKSS